MFASEANVVSETRAFQHGHAFLRGHCRSAMRFGLSEPDRARDRNDPVGATRAWKLFLLLLRLLLHRPARGGNILKCRLKDRFSSLAAGQWGGLLCQSRECSDLTELRYLLGRTRPSEFQDPNSSATRRATQRFFSSDEDHSLTQIMTSSRRT